MRIIRVLIRPLTYCVSVFGPAALLATTALTRLVYRDYSHVTGVLTTSQNITPRIGDTLLISITSAVCL
jgi:hypothetical protein